MEQKIHNYSDLPMKGLSKNFDGVGINEPIIIPLSLQLEPSFIEIWKMSDVEIKLRAVQLNAQIITSELPPTKGAKRQLMFILL